MDAMSAPSVMWFRRDLRLEDNPALLEACAGPAEVLPLFVVDPRLWTASGPARRAYLAASLAALDESLDGRLVVRRGDPVREVVRAADEVGATSVHVSADFGPYGVRRDEAVARALAGRDAELRHTGSPYAVAPGRVVNGSGGGYKVFTPYARAWADHGWRGPADHPSRNQSWVDAPSDGVPDAPVPEGLTLPPAGEGAARRRWQEFLDAVGEYDEARDRPDLDGTSRMSVHLKWGEIHPRTMLADLGHRRSRGAATYRTELAWREFYADVLWHRPESAWEDLRPDLSRMSYDDGPETDRLVAAWREGRTGYPIVDAGMRQLLGEGWMHNRLRMITASFLTKDLHVWWPVGARYFLDQLLDGDIASNSHGWQWVAGTGTDAAPYFRVLNPLRQAHRFDPEGDYVRRWVPELGHLAGPAVHEPWDHPNGYAHGYPGRVVDHDAERREALARYELSRR